MWLLHSSRRIDRKKLKISYLLREDGFVTRNSVSNLIISSTDPTNPNAQRRTIVMIMNDKTREPEHLKANLSVTISVKGLLYIDWIKKRLKNSQQIPIHLS